MMEKPIKMDDLGVPLFLETHIAIVVRFNPIITESNDISVVFLLKSIGDSVIHNFPFCLF